MTDRCKNITLLQTSFAGGKNNKQALPTLRSSEDDIHKLHSWKHRQKIDLIWLFRKNNVFYGPMESSELYVCIQGYIA